MYHKEINNNSHTKIRNVCSLEDAAKKNYKPWMGRKCLQNTYLIKDFYLNKLYEEHYNSTIRIKTPSELHG